MGDEEPENGGDEGENGEEGNGEEEAPEGDGKDAGEWIAVIARVGVTVLAHPIECAKILIQLGHEPFPPYPTKTMFGRPALGLPSVLEYINYIRRRDGISGIYRGMVSRIAGNLIYSIVFTEVTQRWNGGTKYGEGGGIDEGEGAGEGGGGEPEGGGDEGEEEPAEDPPAEEGDGGEGEGEGGGEAPAEGGEGEGGEDKIMDFLKKTCCDMLGRCCAVIASHPFQVITVRKVGQFVGCEAKYTGLFTPVFTILKEDGISGFFSGLVPRLIAEILSLWLANTLTFIINTYIVEDRNVKEYTYACMSFLAGAATYPFTVVSNNMIVNNTGLSAGCPPCMPIYTSWLECWNHLKAHNQLKRGSSLFLRYYTGPYILIEGTPCPTGLSPCKPQWN